ncbi:unnamed protein product [Penicillium salamii]|nr:unnamed protein product [Penicillium salamii]
MLFPRSQGHLSLLTFNHSCRALTLLTTRHNCGQSDIYFTWIGLESDLLTVESFRHQSPLLTMDIDPARRNKKPRLLMENEREKLDEFVDSIHYSARYNDDKFEYRHVQLPKNMLKKIPTEYFDSAKGTLKLLWEEEWRALGITQSLGWEHYEVHEPEPHILLFKRPLNYQPPLQQ